MPASPFPDRPRIDASDKVRGATVYAADHMLPGTLYAMTVPAGIAKGRVMAMSSIEAMRVRGVVRVLTSKDFPRPGGKGPDGAPACPTLVDIIAHRGETVALVVAETLEAAIEGAEALKVTYAAEPFTALIDDPGGKREASPELSFGDVQAALAGAHVVVDATYESPTQHHNPIELLATVAIFANGRVTIYEACQGSSGLKNAVAASLKLDPAIIDVISPTLGGGFGQKDAQRHTALVVRAAILTGKPVKLVIPRGQIFHTASYRPASRHRIRLGADKAGKFVALRYDADHEQSRNGQAFLAGANHGGYHGAGAQLYDVGNYLGTAIDVRLDRQDAGAMRGTYPQPACFAVESAVDELAYKLGHDPVALRLANDMRNDPVSGKPFSSRLLNECLEEGARRFGWARRTPKPGSMKAPNGDMVGWGVASGVYPTITTPAIATLRVRADGSTRFAISGHEMGQGMRTAIAAALVQELDVDASRLEIVLGDTRAVPQHTTGGTWGTASVVPTTLMAGRKMHAAIEELLAGRKPAGNVHRQLAAVRRPFLDVTVAHVAPGQDEKALKSLRDGSYAIAGPEYPTFATHAYSAHFVEVHVEARTRRIRVPRVVTIADCGRVISPRTAASQVYGGVVWGLSHTLREATEIDPRYGGYLNNDLADYAVAVNADIGEIEIGLLDRPDPLVNSAGVKGLGQVTMVGISAAVANAVFHATGRRVRKLPIRVEDLL